MSNMFVAAQSPRATSARGPQRNRDNLMADGRTPLHVLQLRRAHETRISVVASPKLTGVCCSWIKGEKERLGKDALVLIPI